MLDSNKLDANGKSIPHGYITQNGVVVVYKDGGKVSNNYGAVELALSQLPNLVIAVDLRNNVLV